MSAYNILTFPWENQKTGSFHILTIQFKYGQVWQDEYKLGDILNWGENNEGDPSAQEVIVEGVLEKSEPMGNVPEEFEIHIEKNIIKMVIPLQDKNKFLFVKNNFVIIK